MGSTLDKLMVPDGPSEFRTKEFRDVLESHIHLFKADDATTILNVDETDAYVFEFDLFGYLHKKQIKSHLHWLIMRINGWTVPMSFTQNVDHLLIPSQSQIDAVLKMYKSR